MNLRKIETTVAPETHDIGLAVAKVIKEAKRAGADGFQPADIAVVATACFGELMTAINGANQVGAEGKEDLGATARAVILPVLEAVEEVIKKA